MIKLILVSDIWGLTPALSQLADELKASQVIDPYDSQFMAFDDEQQAYNYFNKHVGLEAYTEHLSRSIGVDDIASYVIGFSVGATALWKLSVNQQNIYAGFGFYGSQIRHLTALTPSVPITLILPQSERHFDVNEMAANLIGKSHVVLHPTPYFHGFMNRLSVNYSEQAYEEYKTFIRSQLPSELNKVEST